jgi:hypothetical protein
VAVTKRSVEKADTPVVEQRADTSSSRELSKYRYVGPMASVTVQIDADGTCVKFEHDAVVEVPPGVLDGNPEFEKV